MLDILGPAQQRLCDRLSRREMLRLGGLAPLGLSLPALLAAQQAASAATATGGSRFGRAKRCLLLYMWGGPAHQDTYDLKPDAPDGIRSEFKPIDTNVPGIQFCEHLPNLARHADKLAIVRSLTHSDNNHSTAAHWMLTGRKHRLSAENFGASPEDFPHIGSVLAKFKPTDGTLPAFVALPERISTTSGPIVPGQNGGFLGGRYDPFRIDQHPDEANFAVPTLRLPEGVDGARVRGRQDLLKLIDQARPAIHRARETASMNSYYQQALDLIVSTSARQAFDLQSESAADRDRYGRHTFGQSMLLARRLLESGVKLVTVYWHRDMPGVDTTWDTHANNYPQLKDRLLPQVDQPLGALFDDLQSRNLLDETLVVWSSEFGRTPRVNAAGGRDHWGPCNSVWLAGAGVPGGQIYGSSDRHAAYPDTLPVRPDDFAATLFHLLGIQPETLIHDAQGRPLAVSDGHPISRLIGEA